MPIDLTRVAILRSYDILDTPPEPRFDDIAKLASLLCETPIAIVSFADADRHWYKARVGTTHWEISWHDAVCSVAVDEDLDVLIVDDLAADERFRDKEPIAHAPHLRFYAGVSLRTPARKVIGTLCVADVTPRPGGLTPAQIEGLQALARHVMALVWVRAMVVESAAE